MERIDTFEFTAPLWQYPGAGGWHFVSLPAEIGDDIADMTEPSRAGFGSVRVDATVGATSWQTSIFPDRKTGSYLLPVKKTVRAAEKLQDGDDVRARVRIAEL